MSLLLVVGRRLVCLLLLLMGIGVESTPYIILTSTRSKCVSVIAPQGQTITISYYAPGTRGSICIYFVSFLAVCFHGYLTSSSCTRAADVILDMQLLEEDEELNAANMATEGRTKDVERDEADGQDTEWNRRMKEKLERMKQKKMRDVSITVTQKAGLSGALASRQRKRYGDEKVTGQGRVREELSQRQGSIEFLTGEEDGQIDICVQSIIANRNSPSRISLSVTMAADGEDSEDEDPSVDAGGATVDHEAAKTQMSRLERDLQTLSNRIRAIMNNADFNKEQEVAFQDQSVAMNRSAMYWPIIQLLVIVVTGFTQAHHIIRYMKSHHIGI
jgi:hypothetical protein